MPTEAKRELPSSHVVAAADAAVLASILKPSINLAVWRRDDPIAGGEGIDLGSVEDLRFLTVVADLAPALKRAMHIAGYRAGADDLAADIVALARRFALIMASDRLDLRLEVVETDACRKFHADAVTARLIVSYAGPGTQWLSNADAEALHAGVPIAALAIEQLGTGDVALFKGRIWAPDTAILHRSPPIAQTGVRRLVLVINPGARTALP